MQYLPKETFDLAIESLKKVKRLKKKNTKGDFREDSIYIFKKFIYFSWRLINLQYCSGFCHTLI